MNTSIIDKADWVLMEGAVIERLRGEPGIALHPELLNAPLIYDPAARAKMEDIYQNYIDTGRRADRPFLLLAPTWRANQDRIARSAFAHLDLNGDAVRFVRELRSAAGEYASKILVGGLMACRGDAYKPAEALSRRDAADFHRRQADRLAEAGPDFLMAATLPALSEALGLADAMLSTGLPYIVSFVVRPSGRLLDETPIHQAVREIDDRTDPNPWFYMINCVHPSHAAEALARQPEDLSRRLRGLQGNTAALTPEELDCSTHTISDPPEEWAESMARLREEHGIKILGGCCGSDHRHIQALADRMAEI
jgi:homocysteine S-methyltransferase